MWCVFSTVCLFTASGQAATLAADGPLSTGDGFVSDPQSFVYGNGFTLSADSVITGLNWYGAYKDVFATYSGPDAFSISIYAVHNGAVSLSPVYTFSGLSVSKMPTGLSMPWDYSIFQYDTSVNPQTIAAGDYVLSITNNTPQSDLWLWSWSENCETCEGNYSLFDFGNGLAWNGPYGQSLAFDILGTQASQVPEPNAGYLCVAALLFTSLIRMATRRRGARGATGAK
jgi:hypothetical protein